MLEDPACDEPCNSQVCAWDAGACGYCASGCNEAALGNGICEAECSTTECRFDLNDCGWCDIDCFYDDMPYCPYQCQVEPCLSDTRTLCAPCAGTCE